MSGLQFTTPRTWSVGDIATATMLNALRDQLIFLSTPPLAVLNASAAQTLTSATFTAIGWDTTTVDTYAGHSNVTNNSRYTSQAPGYYLVTAQVGFVPNATGVRVVQIYVNGAVTVAQTQFQNTGGVNNAIGAATGVVFLAAGSYVETFAYQASGGNLATAGSGGSQMTVSLIHQ